MTARTIAPRVAVALTVLTFGLAAVACGDDDSAGDSASANGTAAEGGVGEAKSNADKLYKGTYAEPPAESPPVKRGQNVWVISCGQAIATCSAPANGAVEAAKLLGWENKLIDGKADPTATANAIRQAISANADGIFVMAMDCEFIRQPLAEAKKAGVAVIGVESYDCNESDPSAEPLFAGVVTYVEGPYSDWIYAYGAAQADYIIAKTDGKAEVLNFFFDEVQAGKRFNDGFVEQMKKLCPECKVDPVRFRLADLGTPAMQQKAEQALLKYPNANALQVPTDAAITLGVGAAVQASGRSADILKMGGEGQPPNMDLLRAGRQQDAGVGYPPAWEGYAAMDGLNRIFNGDKPVGSGIGLQLYDKDHNVPASGGYEPPVDFQAAFRKAWGIE